MSNLNQPKKLKAQSIEERLRLMGENFDDYEPVTIKYPNTLLSKDLKKLIVLDNIKTFYDSIISRIDYSKDKLEKVILGDSVTEIDDDAFRGCTSLHEIVIPNSVTKIGDDAFMDCTSLEEIVIPKDNIHRAFCRGGQRIFAAFRIPTVDHHIRVMHLQHLEVILILFVGITYDQYLHISSVPLSSVPVPCLCG